MGTDPTEPDASKETEGTARHKTGVFLGVPRYLAAWFGFRLFGDREQFESTAARIPRWIRTIFSGAPQMVIGLALGALPYVLVWREFFVEPGFNTGEKILVGLLFGFPILVGVTLVQGLITAALLFGKYRVAAVGIWLVYPLFVIALLGDAVLDRIGEALVPPKDHGRIERIRPDGEIRHLLLVMQRRNSDPSGFSTGNFCRSPCISLLRAGVLESVAKEAAGRSGGFHVFRHARDEACSIAEQNRRRYWRLQSERSTVVRQALDLERQLGQPDSEAVRQALSAELERAREAEVRLQNRIAAIITEPRRAANLMEWGHLDECITTTFHDTVEYDIRINYGSRTGGPNIPRMGYIDIHWAGDGDPRRIGRFEAEGGTEPGEPFTVAEIIVGLTGRPFDATVASHPVSSVETELSRLSAAVRQDAYFGSWSNLATWIDDVIEREAARSGRRRLSLSSDEVALLLSMAPAEPQAARDWFFDKIYDHVALESIDALIAGGAPRVNSGR